jgi:fructose-specific phosphotransferase system IIA component
MIKDLLKKELIFDGIKVNGGNKEEALKVISELVVNSSDVSVQELLNGFLKREEESSTGFGGYVAIPHTKLEGVKNPFIAIVRFENDIEWESLDDEPVRVALALVMPSTDKENIHLQVISKFARKLMDDDFVEVLLNEKDKENLYSFIIDEMEG